MNFTVAKTTDGFGAQYQKTIQTYIYCKMHNLNFLYRPFTQVEHNYNNDTNYNNKLRINKIFINRFFSNIIFQILSHYYK